MASKDSFFGILIINLKTYIIIGGEGPPPPPYPDCVAPGFFVHPYDCTKFYRCVDYSRKQDYRRPLTRHDFSCPEGTVFDESLSVCNHPGKYNYCIPDDPYTGPGPYPGPGPGTVTVIDKTPDSHWNDKHAAVPYPDYHHYPKYPYYPYRGWRRGHYDYPWRSGHNPNVLIIYTDDDKK